MSLIQTAALLGSLAASVSAHGYVQGIVAGGSWYSGYNPSFQYQSSPPKVIGWSDPNDLSNGYIAPDAYGTSDIICHLDATNAMAHAVVAAGDQVSFEWTSWPSSHHGPVLTYLAKCDTTCESVDKTTLKFFKIDEGGLIDDTTVPGSWATDNMIYNNNTWTVTLPTSIESGNYVIRHEIIALHGAEEADGAQNYPQCMNLQITGGGSDAPEGVLGTALYKETDAGISVNIYQSLSTYVIPGPALYTGAVKNSMTATALSASTTLLAAPTGTAVAQTGAGSVAASSAVATSAAVSSAAASSSVAAITSQVAVAATSSAAASSVAVATTMATAVVTDNVYTTVTGSAAAATSAVAGLSAIASQLPSGALTSTISSGVPTATASGVATPRKALPAGTTLQDLLEWVDYLFVKTYGSSSTTSTVSKRAHARDLRAARA